MYKIILKDDITEPGGITLAEAGTELFVTEIGNEMVANHGGGTLLVPMGKAALVVNGNPPAAIVSARDGTFWLDGRVSDRLIRQYEMVRCSGASNMLDINGVQREASRLGCTDLVTLERRDYLYLLENYGDLMELYGVERGAWA